MHRRRQSKSNIYKVSGGGPMHYPFARERPRNEVSVPVDLDRGGSGGGGGGLTKWIRMAHKKDVRDDHKNESFTAPCAQT